MHEPDVDIPATKARTWRQWYYRTMKWIRQIHAYLGLFLFPWAMLYGVTAFLLNHPTVFPDHEVRQLEPGDFEGTALEEFPTADEMAERIFETLKQRKPRLMEAYSLSRPEAAQYRMNANMLLFRGGRRHNIVVQPTRRKGVVHIRRPEPRRDNPLASIKRLDFDDPARQKLREGTIQALNRIGIPVRDLNMQGGPLLEFPITNGEQEWIVRYNVGNRNLAARPIEGGPGVQSVQQFLLRLHFTHAFPPDPGVRTFWAIMVDLTSLMLVLWAVTGFLMWWQRRNMRLTGGIVIAISVLWASGLGYLLFQLFRQAP